MKVRTDFVTNSSSSGFVVITVNMKDGKKIELQRDYDSGYGGYVWNATDEKRLDLELFSAKKGKDILTILQKNITDYTSFIVGKDNSGKEFEEKIAALPNLKDVASIDISEETSFDTGAVRNFGIVFAHIKPQNRNLILFMHYHSIPYRESALLFRSFMKKKICFGWRREE